MVLEGGSVAKIVLVEGRGGSAEFEMDEVEDLTAEVERERDAMLLLTT